MSATAPASLVVAAALAGLVGCTDASQARPVNPTGGDPARGARAIERYGCGGCHTIPGIRGADGVVGPPLYFIARRTFIAGHLANTPDNLAAWIANPPTIEPRTPMPALGLTESELRDVVAYLYTLR